MELLTVSNHLYNTVEIISSTDIPFIHANTIAVPFTDIEHRHLIPVYVKDNEPVISHQDFINSALEIIHHLYKNETILPPSN